MQNHSPDHRTVGIEILLRPGGLIHQKRANVKNKHRSKYSTDYRKTTIDFFVCCPNRCRQQKYNEIYGTWDRWLKGGSK